MKTIITVIVLLAVCSSTSAGFDLTKAESLEYRISYLGIPVVRAYIEGSPIAESDSGFYRISIHARTTKFWSMFYRVDNFYWTYVDSFGTPLVYRRDINEKPIDKQTQQSYDHQYNRIYYEGNTAIDHPGELENFFSGVYRLRIEDLEVGMIDSFYINIEKSIWQVRCKVEKTMEIQMEGMNIECLQIDVKFDPLFPDVNRLKTDILSNKLVNSETVLKIYLTNDRWRLPVRMDYRMSPFDVKATITELPEEYLDLLGSK